MFVRGIVVSFVVVCTLLTAAVSNACAGESPTVFQGDELAACDADTTARIRFIEQRLQAGRPYARNWWTFFTMFYGTGSIYSFVDGATKDDNGRRANSFVSGAKALFGTARLLFDQPTAKLGAGPMYAVDVDSREACREVLAIGEDLLRKNAKESQERYSWKAHLASVAINVAGALIVAEGYDEPRHGWTSAGVGIAVGEVFAWSHPWNGTADLEDYEREFGDSRSAVLWKLAPTESGLQVLARF